AWAGGLLDREGRLAETVRCVGCGYDLKRARPEEGCPECGTEVVDSLRAMWGAFGLDDEWRLRGSMACVSCGADVKGLRPQEGCRACGVSVTHTLRASLLSHADAGWLRGVRRGMVGLYVGTGLLILAGAVAGVTGTLLATPWGAGWGWWLLMLLSLPNLVASTVWLWGVFAFTTAEPAGRRLGDAGVARFARVSELCRFVGATVSSVLMVALVASGVVLATQTTGAGFLVSQMVAAVVMALGAISMAGVVRYLGQLVGRVPRSAWAGQARVAASVLIAGVVWAGSHAAQMVAMAASASGSMAAEARDAGGSAAAVAAGGPQGNTSRIGPAGVGQTQTLFTTYPDGSTLMEQVTTNANGVATTQSMQVQGGFGSGLGGSGGGASPLMIGVLAGCTSFLAMLCVAGGYVWALVLSVLWMTEVDRALRPGEAGDGPDGPMGLTAMLMKG
ncbi:MAG: hypothetical protein AAF078_12290, partial [Planctomycetota bacterium]